MFADVYAFVFVCVHSALKPSCPLKLHTLLSGLCSQQSHLEMKFKTETHLQL